MNASLLDLQNVSKQFTLHNQNGAQLRVLNGVTLTLNSAECLVLDGPSGMGKSTLLKLVYANYRASTGTIRMRDIHGETIEVTEATPQALVRLRNSSIGYVSQFLRVIPRIPALDIVAEPLCNGALNDLSAVERARERARALLTRLRIPERLWQLPPATFSGGEQQRINVARNLIQPKPLLLLDEPTASLDAANTETVITMIEEAKARGAAIIGIFHDTNVGRRVATRHLDITEFREPQ
jgi:alpha-D-ribose 1-methylphosphonate 5-triphosphate synthase subunit PhnL